MYHLNKTPTSLHRMLAHFPQVWHMMQHFDMKLPIIQAPMAGVDNQALAIKIAALGGMGARAMGYTAPVAMQHVIATLKSITNHFQINLFLPDPALADIHASDLDASIQHLQQYLAPYYAHIGLTMPTFKYTDIHILFKQQLDLAIEQKVPCLSFAFGLPDAAIITRCHNADIKVIATATTIHEAKALAHIGCDAIVVQGLEAGGHRGGFVAGDLTGQLPLLTLLQALKPVIKIPMIAAGGIRDAKKAYACFEAGASALQIGTALLACSDCDAISGSYRQLLLDTPESDILITPAISGRCARGIHNTLFKIMQTFYEMPPHARLPYPFPHLLTAPLRAHSASINEAAWIAAWSGVDEVKLKCTTIQHFLDALLGIH